MSVSSDKASFVNAVLWQEKYTAGNTTVAL